MPDGPRLDDDLRAAMRERLARFERRSVSPGALRHAAVAVTLVDDGEGQACFVITRRAARLKDHAGQWALPGGSLDAGEGVHQAALRELHEEVGIDVASDQILGLLDDYPTRSGFLITPVVVWGGAGAVMTPNPREVARAYRVPLEVLDRPEVPRLHRIPESDRLVISIPMLGTDVNAPTAAVLFQFREVAMRGLLETRVDHYDQPVFAWK